WLGPEVPTANTKTWWQCKVGHSPWSAKYGHIQQGSSCPKCRAEKLSEAQRFGPNRYRALAKLRKFKWLGPPVPNANTKTGWQCEKEHSWMTSYAHIMSGQGCPFCSGKRQSIPEQLVKPGGSPPPANNAPDRAKMAQAAPKASRRLG